MKNMLSKLTGATLIVCSITVLPSALPSVSSVLAQAEAPSNNAPNLDTTPLQETEGTIDNFGWLGLIGLLGLLNLFRKPKAADSYPTTTTGEDSTGPRY